MKQLIAYSLLVIMYFQPFVKGAVVVSFYLHQKEIAANLCEKRFQPEKNKCKGSCQLKKQLKETESSQAPISTFNFQQEMTLFFQAIITVFLQPPILEKLPNLINQVIYLAYISQDHLFSIFRPPIP